MLAISSVREKQLLGKISDFTTLENSMTAFKDLEALKDAIKAQKQASVLYAAKNVSTVKSFQNH